MSEGYIIGGGGSALNFKVIAVSSELLLPATAKENTIAVITDTAITAYVFSSTAPTSPAEGMVWFATGTNSTVGFNAIKKNGLWVYPTGCQQYVSGAWVSRTAKTYQNGAWVDWTRWLYNNGDEVTSVTGGWKSINEGQVTTVKGTDRITITQISPYNYFCSCLHTTNKIDLSQYVTLYCKLNLKSIVKTGTNLGVCVGINTGTPNAVDAYRNYMTLNTRTTTIGTQTVACDISSIMASAYIEISEAASNLDVFGLWLE